MFMDRLRCGCSSLHLKLVTINQIPARLIGRRGKHNIVPERCKVIADDGLLT